MVTTRSKARQLEQATNDGGLKEQGTKVTQDTTLANRHPAGTVVYRGAVRGAADNNASTHGKDTESNGALIPRNPEENESSLIGSDSPDASKAKHTTSNDSHAQDPSVAPATLETNASDKPEVLSDASRKAAAKSNTNAANTRTKPRRKRGRKPTRPRSKKRLSVADSPAPHCEVLQDADCARAGSTLVDVDRLPEPETPINHLPSAPHGNETTLTTLPSHALPRGKGKAVDLTKSSIGCSHGTDNETTDAADALLQLWTSRPSEECRRVRPSSTDEPAPVVESSTQPRRSYRLEKKKEKKEEERREKERLEKERQEKERQEKEEKAKQARSTGNKANDTATKKKGKGTRTPAPRSTANATKRKHEVVDIEGEDATANTGPQRKRVACQSPEKARNRTEHPTHGHYSPASCSSSLFGSTDSFESSETSEAVNVPEAIDISGTISASRARETFEPFDVKQRIRNYMEVSTLRKTLRGGGYEDPLDEDDASSPALAFRRIIPPPSRFGCLPQPYYVGQSVPMQLGNIWRPAMCRQ